MGDMLWSNFDLPIIIQYWDILPFRYILYFWIHTTVQYFGSKLSSGPLARSLDPFLERFFRKNENNEMHLVKSCSDVLGPSFWTIQFFTSGPDYINRNMNKNESFLNKNVNLLELESWRLRWWPSRQVSPKTGDYSLFARWKVLIILTILIHFKNFYFLN